MLNILLGEDNKPENNYIHDVEREFLFLKTLEPVSSEIIIRRIDGGHYLDNKSFIDKYGYKLPITSLSTGSKILLLVNNTDKVINGIEMGQNAFELLIQSVDGTIYLEDAERFDLPEYFDIKHIQINGNGFTDIIELEDNLWKE